jgi:hypothetical protein
MIERMRFYRDIPMVYRDKIGMLPHAFAGMEKPRACSASSAKQIRCMDYIHFADSR